MHAEHGDIEATHIHGSGAFFKSTSDPKKIYQGVIDLSDEANVRWQLNPSRKAYESCKSYRLKHYRQGAATCGVWTVNAFLSKVSELLIEFKIKHIFERYERYGVINVKIFILLHYFYNLVSIYFILFWFWIIGFECVVFRHHRPLLLTLHIVIFVIVLVFKMSMMKQLPLL